MATETVTLPRETLEQIREALRAAVDASVGVQGICATADDGLNHGCVYGIESCIYRQEELVCPALEVVTKALEEVSHHG